MYDMNEMSGIGAGILDEAATKEAIPLILLLRDETCIGFSVVVVVMMSALRMCAVAIISCSFRYHYVGFVFCILLLERFSLRDEDLSVNS